MRVLVTDGGSRAALAVTRSLGQAGHEVIVGERYAPALAQASKYCRRSLVYPDPARAWTDFVTCIGTVIREDQVDILIPISDISMFLLTANRDKLGRCSIPFPDAAVVRRAADKVEVTETARRLGVPVPESIVVGSADAVPASRLAFPVVIKPRQSRILGPNGWVSSAVSFAKDLDSLRADLAARPAHEFPLLLQERIEGPGMGVFAYLCDGRPQALFSHRRLRERPPWGGVSVLSESVPLDPFAADCATRLLEAIGWRDGVAMVEFKHDVRDNRPKLMEINGRFWGSLQLAIDAGVDFPRLLVEGARTDEALAAASYRVGVRSRWLWGDIDALLLTLAGRAKAMGVRRSRVRAIADFLGTFGRDVYDENPRRDDLGPWWYEMRQRLMSRHTMPLASGSDPVRSSIVASSVRGGSDTTTGLHARVVRSMDATGLDAASWNALVSRSETNSIFQTYQWLRSWCDTYDRRYEPLLATVYEGARVVGVLPFMRQRHRDQCVARFLGDTRADYCDIITGDRRRDIVRLGVDALLRAADIDILELNNLPRQSGTIEQLRGVAVEVECRAFVAEQSTCPTLLIADHVDAAKRIWQKESLRRRVNYFRRTGRLTVRHLTTAREIEPYLEGFFAMHVRRRAVTASPSLFLESENADFYRRMTTAMSDSGWLLFTVLEYDDEPIAFHYGFDYGDGVLWYKPTFDMRHAKHSPGLVLVSHVMEYAIGRNRRELDFTVGDERFKDNLTNHSRTVVGVTMFRHPVDYAVEAWRRAVVRTIKETRELVRWN